MNKSDNKEQLPVRFNLLQEQNKIVMLSVNRFLPLINYKRNI